MLLAGEGALIRFPFFATRRFLIVYLTTSHPRRPHEVASVSSMNETAPQSSLRTTHCYFCPRAEGISAVIWGGLLKIRAG